MSNISNVRGFIESLAGAWDLTHFEYDVSKNCLVLLTTKYDDHCSPPDVEEKKIILEEVISFQYCPHLSEPLPSLFFETVFEVLNTYSDLKPHESYFSHEYYAPFFPIYKLSLTGWEFKFTIICKSPKIVDAISE